MDEEKKNIIQLMLGFVRRANGDHVSAYAAQAAYFLIMSFIPFILFLTTLIRYTPLSYNVVRDAIIGFVPGNLQPGHCLYLPCCLQCFWSFIKCFQTERQPLKASFRVHL